MRRICAALLLLFGSLELHSGGHHHSSEARDRLVAPEAAHPGSDRHLEASASILERACPWCATAARGLGLATAPAAHPVPLATIALALPAIEAEPPAPLLLPPPTRGPPAR